MRFVSSRRGERAVTISTAIRAGQPEDGGLFIPRRLPSLSADMSGGRASLARFASAFLGPFFADDPLAAQVEAMCETAFSFPAPLKTPDPARSGLLALELFHGPTGAFKDFGARFLMACLDHLGDRQAPLTVLAATSGDTGAAAGGAAEGREGLRAVILFPKNRVSKFQRHQLCCWGEPVRAIEIEGDFDDCQRLVKAAFADKDLSARHRLTSANSINIARLLPQAAYLAHAAWRVFDERAVRPGLIIPTGNLGHGVAALYARAMGAPLGPVVLATNANAALHDWSLTGEYRPRASIATIANAMDVGAPGNFERLGALPDPHARVRVECVDDDVIRSRIIQDYETSGYIWCPHSATAAEAYARLPERERMERPWVVAATAHPFKFADIIEPLIGRAVEPAPAFASVLERAPRVEACEANTGALVERLAALSHGA